MSKSISKNSVDEYRKSLATLVESTKRLRMHNDRLEASLSDSEKRIMIERKKTNETPTAK